MVPHQPLSTRFEVIGAIRDVLTTFPEILVCILCGSASRDHLAPHSDIDVAVGGGRRLSSETLDRLRDALGQACGREVDLIDLEALSGLLWEILWTEGLFLLKDHDLVVKYTGKVQAFVEDVKPALMKTINYRLEKEFGPQ